MELDTKRQPTDLKGTSPDTEYRGPLWHTSSEPHQSPNCSSTSTIQTAQNSPSELSWDGTRDSKAAGSEWLPHPPSWKVYTCWSGPHTLGRSALPVSVPLRGPSGLFLLWGEEWYPLCHKIYNLYSHMTWLTDERMPWGRKRCRGQPVSCLVNSCFPSCDACANGGTPNNTGWWMHRHCLIKFSKFKLNLRGTYHMSYKNLSCWIL